MQFRCNPFKISFEKTISLYSYFLKGKKNLEANFEEKVRLINIKHLLSCANLRKLIYADVLKNPKTPFCDVVFSVTTVFLQMCEDRNAEMKQNRLLC